MTVGEARTAYFCAKKKGRTGTEHSVKKKMRKNNCLPDKKEKKQVIL